MNAAQARPPRTARDGLTIKRRRCGAGFSYHGKNGRQIRDPRIVSRLASLAVPPAYVDVVYAKDESAPLQAMGATPPAGGNTAIIPIGKRCASAARAGTCSA